MTPSSEAKGRRLQQMVAAMILKAFPSLAPDDVRSCSMSNNGQDVQLSPAARALVPYSIECKARSGLKTIYGRYDQARSHGPHEPLLILKQDRRARWSSSMSSTSWRCSRRGSPPSVLAGT